jgi:hypothetical protein
LNMNEWSLGNPLVNIILIAGSLVSIILILNGIVPRKRIKPALILSLARFSKMKNALVHTVSFHRASTIKKSLLTVSAHSISHLKKGLQQASNLRTNRFTKSAQTGFVISNSPTQIPYPHNTPKMDDYVRIETPKAKPEEPKPKQQILQINKPATQQSECPHYSEYFAQPQRSKEIPAHCLICENVIACVSTSNKTPS